MPTCVSEGSYTTLFIFGVVACVLMLISSAYYYDQFNKASNNQLTATQFVNRKNYALGFVILGIIALTSLLVVFFGFRTRLIGVYASTSSPNMAKVIS